MTDPSEGTPPYLYATHYSNPANVMFFLIRLEPFSTLHIELMSGKFDHADRLFDSIPSCWSGVLSYMADVKELTPEFFYCPDILLNKNQLPLGVKQNGVALSDVILPPWASSAFEFIELHRQALESNYVSANIDEWIDLIFGFKQIGQAAIDANNVFHYLSYEGFVDIDAITDETQRIATEAHISNFGQTPSQLFFKKHPKRASVALTMQPPRTLESNKFYLFWQCPSSSAITHITSQQERLITISAARLVVGHHFDPFPNFEGLPFSYYPDNSTLTRRVGGTVSSEAISRNRLYAISLDGRLLFSAGHWDNSEQFVVER